MQESFDIPVLLLFFNRPSHARSVIAALRPIRPQQVYVHIDGPRKDRIGEEALVLEVQESLRLIDWDCTVHPLIRSENYGLRKGVKGALDWFFEAEPMGIVLEDDCNPDVSFFPFCKEMLLKYADNEQIMHIAANNLTEAYTEHIRESYVFSRFSFVWGWASWRRAWQRMDVDMKGLDDYAKSESFALFLPNKMARSYMLDKFKTTQEKRNHSWAYAWFFSILKNNGLCIVPKVNLSQNTGIGIAGATNTNAKNDHAARAARALAFPLVHPKTIEIVSSLEQQFFYDSQKAQHRLWLWQLKKTILGD